MKTKRLSSLLLLVLTLVLVLAGCKNGGNNGSSSSSQGVSFKVDDKTVMVSNDDDNTKKLLAVKVSLKNDSKTDLSFSEDDFSLKDAQGHTHSTDSSYLGDVNDSVKKLDYGKLSNGESKTGWLLYDVKPGKKYTLTFKATMFDKSDESKDVNISKPVDTKVVTDDSKEANKAAKAYIQAVFFHGSDKDYKTYISNDLDKEQAKVYKETSDEIFDRASLDNTLDSDQEAAFAQLYQEENADKTKIKTKVKSMSADEAIINISGYTMKLDDAFSNYTMPGEDETVDPVEFAKGFVSSMDDHDPTKINSEYVDLTLKRDGNKWKVVTTGDDYDRVVDIFDGTGY